MESRHAIKIANKESPMTKKKRKKEHRKIITFHNFYWLVTLCMNSHEILFLSTKTFKFY